MLKLISEMNWTEVIGTTLGVAITILAAVAKAREILLKTICWPAHAIKEMKVNSGIRKQIPDTLAAMGETLDSMKTDLSDMKKELHTNGGSSIKDAIIRMEKERTHDFWYKPYPAFRCLQDGKVSMTSQAYMELVKTSSELDLKGLGWRQFVADQTQGDNFYRRWLEVARADSNFSSPLKIVAVDGEFRGEWMVKILPLGACGGDGIFSGALFPIDDVARRIAVQHRWFSNT